MSASQMLLNLDHTRPRATNRTVELELQSAHQRLAQSRQEARLMLVHARAISEATRKRHLRGGHGMRRFEAA